MGLREFPQRLEHKLEHESLDMEAATLNGSRTESLFAAISQSSIMAATDLSGRLTEVSDQFCLISGYAREELLGANPRILKSGFHGPLFFQKMWSVLQAGGTWRGRICNRRKDGELYWVATTISPTRDALGQVDGFLSFRIDITDLENVNNALASSKKALAEETAFVGALFDTLKAHIAVLDPEGMIVKVNKAWSQFASENQSDGATCLGTGLSYFIGSTLDVVGEVDAVAMADDAASGIRMVQAGLSPCFRMEYACHSETVPRWFSMCVLPVPGHPGTVIVTHENITEARQLAEEHRQLVVRLTEAHRLESLGTLAGSVAHDMNNVLTAIHVITAAMLEKRSGDNPESQHLHTIIKAAARGERMVKTLLLYAHQSPAEHEEEAVDMTNVIQEVVQLLKWTTLAKVDLTLDLAEDLHPIRGDEAALVRAIMNLCSNAVDSMPANGTLTLRSRNGEGPWTEVLVEDSGCGMSKEVLEKARAPFFTTKGVGKGTGLGLPSVYDTVNAHRGQILIQSELGKGTCVTLQFPNGPAGT
jgi:PAS domain S-box-containing protein